MTRFFVPETVQTSAMDCGPAALTSLLAGFGLRVSYGRLREACQTNVDGTSIDVLEAVANRLGLSAEQVMLPVDHLLLKESAALPAIVVTRLPQGLVHFVVVWQMHGQWVQVMDPALGRRWMRRAQLLRDVYVHPQAVPAEAFDTWVRSPDFQAVLIRRMRDLGAGRAARTLIANAASEPDWRGLAALDAAIRLTATLTQDGGVRRGRSAADMIAAIWKRALTDDRVIPESFWFARPARGDAPDALPNCDGTNDAGAAEESVIIRGAVFVRALGIKRPDENADPLPPELSAALAEPKPRPWAAARQMLGTGGWTAIFAMTLIVLLHSGLSLLETAFLRGFIDLGRDLGLVEQRVIALALLLGFGAALWWLDVMRLDGLQRLGRQLEVKFRLAFAAKLPRLHDRYFQSRPVSDMAERSHMLQLLRQVPQLFGQFAQTSTMLALTAGMIGLFDPASGPLAGVIAGVSLGLPWLFQPWLTELDMRMRTHSGALTRFYFDALQGLSAIQAHAAERNIEREQESLLVEWAQTARRYLSASVLLEGLQITCGFGLAALLLARHVHALADTGGALLLAYWALSLPELGGQLASLIRQYPWQRNTLLRLLEPLGAPESSPAAEPATIESPVLASRTQPRPLVDAHESQGPAPPTSTQGCAIRFDDVGVVAGGRMILRNVALDIEAGSHVAVVGPSGAGKSSLLGVLLGWHRSAEGQVLIDGRPLDGARLDQLRRETAWVDPSVHLWNKPLVDNLRFGNDDVDADRLGAACRHAEIIDVLEKLPDGLQTLLGEGGGLLSGGQGQRVRLGRALAHRGPRLVLLDEPFRGLAGATRRELTRRVREQFRGATLLFVSHDLRGTLEFDRVLVVADGHVTEDGVPSDLAAREGSLYARLLDAERSIERDVWHGRRWRRLELVSGRLTEAQA